MKSTMTRRGLGMRDARATRLTLAALGVLVSACRTTTPPVATVARPVSASVVDTLTHPAWTRNAVIYEVNVRQFTPEGTLAGVKAHLPRLKALGVDMIWLMPVQPIGRKNRKGPLGSYYSIADYTAINP